MDVVLGIATIVLVLMFLSGLFGLITGRPAYPESLASRLPQRPAASKDYRLVGATAIFGAIAIGLNLVNAEAADLSLTVASAAFFTISFVLYLSARFYDRRDGQVRSGWQSVRRAFQQPPTSH